MNRIFISYRRDDSAGHAGRLFDRLGARLGKDSVFMDVEGIEAGLDFVETIEAAVGSCDVLLAVIGRGWLDIKDSQGRRRLDDPRDFIRLETATALARHIRVIPVLVEGAAMPSEESLPDVLRPLTRRQAVELRDSRWEADIENLIGVLEHLLAVASPQGRGSAADTTPAAGAGQPGLPGDRQADGPRRSPGLWPAAGAGLIALGAAIGYLRGPTGQELPPESPSPPAGMKAPASSPPTATMPAPSREKPRVAAPDPPRQNAGQNTVSPVARRQSESLKAEPAAGSAPADPPGVARRATRAAGPPAQAARPPAAGKAPRIAIIALGEPGSRAFWGGESEPSYSAKMAGLYGDTLREQVRDRVDAHAGSDRARAKPLMDGSPGLDRRICESTQAVVVLVALAQQSFAISPADSAYWPELRLGAIACASGKRHVSRYNLAPRQGESFPFAQDMAQAMAGFVRENLHLMQ
jgi:hypothetical protein